MRSLSWGNARFAYPMHLAKTAQEIDTHLALQSLLRQMETETVPETGEWDSKIPDYYRNAALVYQRGQALNILAAALKLYRSEHGAYPAALENLVPEYLDALPVYPDTRKPYRYASDGHSKFGLEAINGKACGFSFDVSELKRISDEAARVLDVPVYGGDCVVSEDGTIGLIDFNDWPSFSRCREAASKAIASRILKTCCNG